ADLDRPLWPGRAGVHHHVHAGHDLGQPRLDAQCPADPRARPGRCAELDQHHQATLRTPAAGDFPMSHAVLAVAIVVAQILLLLAMSFSLIRMVRGPRAQDRVLALDALYVNAMLLLLTIGIRTGSGLYIEA